MTSRFPGSLSPARRLGARWLGPVETNAPHTADPPDSGRALIEVIFLAVLLLIPVLYILIGVLRLQATTFAVTQAARDAGRAIDSAATIDNAIARAEEIAAIDLADQNVPNDNITVQYVAAGATCNPANAITPSLAGGAVYDVCVTAVVTLPGVPSVLTGSNNTITGVYTVHIGELRENR
jgi:Flp pilus assembly protein TadG